MAVMKGLSRGWVPLHYIEKSRVYMGKLLGDVEISS